MSTTETTNPTWGSLPTGQKAVWIIGGLIVALLLFGAMSSEGNAPAATSQPDPATAVCGEFFEVMNSDLDGDGLLIAVATIAEKAKSTPVEAEAREVVAAAMSGDQARSVEAVRAMTAACGR